MKSRGFITLLISCALAIFFLSLTWNAGKIKEKLLKKGVVDPAYELEAE